jgi:hypothetical protein
VCVSEGQVESAAIVIAQAAGVELVACVSADSGDGEQWNEGGVVERIGHHTCFKGAYI